ncbi:MAG: hypothetical protein PVG99_05030 [Desulfobacteraceae bacterium]|jgi:hypothetical protein
MKALFGDILKLDDVQGILLFSFDGRLMFKEFLSGSSEEPKNEDSWPSVIRALDRIKEADLVFDRGKVHIRRTELGYLLVLMGLFAPTAMVRLNCGILLPSLKEMKTSKAFKRLFKKKG